MGKRRKPVSILSYNVCYVSVVYHWSRNFNLVKVSHFHSTSLGYL